MKKHGILNQPISSVIAEMGHKDQLTICDAGLPIPELFKRIDLAIQPGFPDFLQVVRAVADELQVEAIFMAEEVKGANPSVAQAVQEIFPEISVNFVPHSEFKQMSQDSRAYIRTGECTPFANVILVSGVIF
jgi:D-ribose pyranase